MSRHTFNWFPVLNIDDLVFNSVIQPSGVARPRQSVPSVSWLFLVFTGIPGLP